MSSAVDFLIVPPPSPFRSADAAGGTDGSRCGRSTQRKAVCILSFCQQQLNNLWICFCIFHSGCILQKFVCIFLPNIFLSDCAFYKFPVISLYDPLCDRIGFLPQCFRNCISHQAFQPFPTHDSSLCIILWHLYFILVQLHEVFSYARF